MIEVGSIELDTVGTFLGEQKVDEGGYGFGSPTLPPVGFVADKNADPSHLEMV